MDTAACHLFVYGSLRPRFQHPMGLWLASRSQFCGAARYQGALYLIDWYPAALPSDHPDDQIEGDLLWIPDPQTVWPELDRFEDCRPDTPLEGEYQRKWIEVTLMADQRRERCQTYLYNRSVNPLQRIPDGLFKGWSDDCSPHRHA
jgi:gamma-glutamylcyclotransferase (GGCT)/AIG2-like uncharacterized protein YtfP